MLRFLIKDLKPVLIYFFLVTFARGILNRAGHTLDLFLVFLCQISQRGQKNKVGFSRIFTIFQVSDMEKNYSSYDDLSDKEVELLSSSQPQQTEDKSDESSDPDSMELDSSGSEFSPPLGDDSSVNSDSQVYSFIFFV